MVIVFIVNILVIALAVIIHYEFLYRITVLMPRLTLEGNFDGSLWDCAYFSFTTFTTLGFGDIQPMGDLRFLTGLESLTGLVLITWTASFLYLEMTRYWNEN